MERAFCPNCGTRLVYRHAGFPDEVDITTCSLDDPDQAAPLDHTQAASRLRWRHLDDDWPVYPRTRVD